MQTKQSTGHLIAFITIIIWGTTFISTKILLVDFTPIEILFFRFIMGFVALLIVFPHRMKVKNKKHELYIIAAGITGITLYYLLENIALTYTMASNVGVISSLAPFFTAIVAYLFLKEEPLRVNFFIGFLIAMIGLGLISFNGATNFQINPIGDLLAITATLVWAIYSVITRKISSFGYNTLQVTRRMFFYGLIFMLPTLFFFDFKFGFERFSDPVNLFNIIFLGLGASALCFVTWNFSVKILGPIKTSIYIYLIPVVTVVTSVIVLDEKITLMSALGTILAIAGLFISEGRIFIKKKNIDRKIA
ncbi:DMT family transporter [Pallidibacillus pasinlerensis]|uniref:DMT family transporter n=1 Tax=Pallidibacillus pasinlerensis TaxID=2703818 RepID=A0ABX0AA51_9BACI|nr:DMT family transporter [Pallidibacillus pasinlerensis]NCU19080.1 DMT family transporter [Pallidibacillus pasinlerensis]